MRAQWEIIRDKSGWDHCKNVQFMRIIHIMVFLVESAWYVIEREKGLKKKKWLKIERFNLTGNVFEVTARTSLHHECKITALVCFSCFTFCMQSTHLMETTDMIQRKHCHTSGATILGLAVNSFVLPTLKQMGNSVFFEWHLMWASSPLSTSEGCVLLMFYRLGF